MSETIERETRIEDLLRKQARLGNDLDAADVLMLKAAAEIEALREEIRGLEHQAEWASYDRRDDYGA